MSLTYYGFERVLLRTHSSGVKKKMKINNKGFYLPRLALPGIGLTVSALVWSLARVIVKTDRTKPSNSATYNIYIFMNNVVYTCFNIIPFRLLVLQSLDGAPYRQFNGIVVFDPMPPYYIIILRTGWRWLFTLNRSSPPIRNFGLCSLLRRTKLLQYNRKRCFPLFICIIIYIRDLIHWVYVSYGYNRNATQMYCSWRL